MCFELKEFSPPSGFFFGHFKSLSEEWAFACTVYTKSHRCEINKGTRLKFTPKDVPITNSNPDIKDLTKNRKFSKETKSQWQYFPNPVLSHGRFLLKWHLVAHQHTVLGTSKQKSSNPTLLSALLLVTLGMAFSFKNDQYRIYQLWNHTGQPTQLWVHYSKKKSEGWTPAWLPECHQTPLQLCNAHVSHTKLYCADAYLTPVHRTVRPLV